MQRQLKRNKVVSDKHSMTALLAMWTVKVADIKEPPDKIEDPVLRDILEANQICRCGWQLGSGVEGGTNAGYLFLWFALYYVNGQTWVRSTFSIPASAGTFSTFIGVSAYHYIWVDSNFHEYSSECSPIAMFPIPFIVSSSDLGYFLPQ